MTFSFQFHRFTIQINIAFHRRLVYLDESPFFIMDTFLAFQILGNQNIILRRGKWTKDKVDFRALENLIKLF